MGDLKSKHSLLEILFRYIMVEVKETGTAEDKTLKIDSTTFYHTLLRKIQELHGDFGVAATRGGMNVKYCNENTRLVIIKARHGPHKLLGSSLPFIQKMDNKSVIINTLYTGATLKQCFKFALKHQQQNYDEFVSTLKSDKDKELFRDALTSLDDTLVEDS